MAMGFAGSFADVMGWDEIKKLCPKQSSAVESILKKNGIDLNDYIRFLALEDDDALPETADAAKLTSLFANLQEAFSKATKVGRSSLELCPCYHSEDEGDRYDEVQGGFFHVEGVYQLSPAGKKLGNKIQRCHYVQFG